MSSFNQPPADNWPPTVDRSTPSWPVGKPPQSSPSFGFPGGKAGLVSVIAIAVLLLGSGSVVALTHFLDRSSSGAHTTSANAVVIKFTRATHELTAPNPLVPFGGASSVPVNLVSAQVSNASSAPIQADAIPAQPFRFTITVTNNTAYPLADGSRGTITSKKYGYHCITGPSDTIPGNGTATTYCDVQESPIQADTWYSVGSTMGGSQFTYSGSNPAGAATPAHYEVPSACPANDSLQASVNSQLQSRLQLQLPTGAIGVSSPTITLGNITCIPATGTQQPNAFTYTEQLSGSATQNYVLASDIQKYQQQQLASEAAALSGSWVVTESSVCPNGPSPMITPQFNPPGIQCATSGQAAWKWDRSALSALAASVKGQTVANARALLNANPGIQTGTIDIGLPDGATLPSDPALITFMVMDA